MSGIVERASDSHTSSTLRTMLPQRRWWRSQQLPSLWFRMQPETVRWSWKNRQTFGNTQPAECWRWQDFLTSGDRNLPWAFTINRVWQFVSAMYCAYGHVYYWFSCVARISLYPSVSTCTCSQLTYSHLSVCLSVCLSLSLICILGFRQQFKNVLCLLRNHRQTLSSHILL